MGKNSLWAKQANGKGCRFRNRPDPIKTATFEQAMAARGVTKIPVLKMDCEGCEYELLPTLTRPDIRARTFFGG